KARLILARPFTRPDPSASSTRPCSFTPRARTVSPWTMIGSARVARKTSPDLFVLLLRASIKVTSSGVPSGIWKTALTLGRSASRFPAFGAFGFAGVAGAAVLTDEVALSCGGWSGWAGLAAASSVEAFGHSPHVEIRVAIKKVKKKRL